jgi:hypothetical protein
MKLPSQNRASGGLRSVLQNSVDVCGAVDSSFKRVQGRCNKRVGDLNKKRESGLAAGRN